MSPYANPTSITADDAASKLAHLCEAYNIGRFPACNTAAIDAVRRMFTERWPDLSLAAHQLHDALAIRDKLNMTDPSRNANPAPPGAREVHEPEYDGNRFGALDRLADRITEAFNFLNALRDRIAALETGLGGIGGVRDLVNQQRERIEDLEKWQASSKVTFVDGNAVTRKTGGPMMTVEAVRTDRFVQCIWFDGGELRRDTFHAYPADAHTYLC